MVVMLYVNWKLALLTFAVLPVIALVTASSRKAVRDSYRRIRTAIARINAYLQEHLTGMAVMQLFNREAAALTNLKPPTAPTWRRYKDFHPGLRPLPSRRGTGGGDCGRHHSLYGRGMAMRRRRQRGHRHCLHSVLASDFSAPFKT